MPLLPEHLSSCWRARARLFAIGMIHLCLFTLAGCGAFWLRFEFKIPPNQYAHLSFALAIWLTVKSVVFHLYTVNRGTWRFVSLVDALILFYANLTGSLTAALALRFVAPPGFPRSIYVIDFLLCFLLTTGVRAVVRLLTEATAINVQSDYQRAVIYGAGAAGIMLLREVRSNPAMGYRICGFIDDSPGMVGLSIYGMRVLGTGEALAKVAAKHGVQQVLIAIPSATGKQMLKILGYCTSAKLSFRTVPALSEMIQENGSNLPIRDVAVEDLLGRIQVRLEDASLRVKLENRIILVSGAAGSIGSELCRQIARFAPKLIIGLDLFETGLFFLDRELRQSFPTVPFEPVIANVQNFARLAEILSAHDIAAVFHAAAYKHVPVMEAHLFEAVANNVFGTYNLAVNAERFGVRDFVMISSDKAVRPTSIMGLTKRVAEVLVSSLQNGRTKYVSVRFGNVLGSNGSVVPIFKQQIAAGGPVTVTHPEMRRYFMTIPEAVQLVLQASTMGNGGEIFVLDMGEPIKIVDLARNMIVLSGRRPEDIQIEFTGMRPGEKLYEELSTATEETCPTYHEKIRIFSGNGTRIADIEVWMEQLRRMCESRDMRLILTLKELVSDYNPSSQVLRQLILERSTTRVSIPPVQALPLPISAGAQ